MAVQCLLWDFGDTLFDELSLWRASPEWMAVYRSLGDAASLGAAWNLGHVDLDAFAAHVAERLGMTHEHVHRHLTRTDLFVPFPYTLEFYRQRHLPQAIVTVNPTTFRRLASELGLDQAADAIVISGEERSTDKGLLCERALERMGVACSPAEALLIDDRHSNLAAWAGRGGIGYHYRGDDVFRADVAGGLDSLVRPVS